MRIWMDSVLIFFPITILIIIIIAIIVMTVIGKN